MNAFVEIFGDRWSLLVVRDLMLRGYTTYKELRSCDEGIATNILAERLDRLLEAGVIESEADPSDGRKVRYRLTLKGIDLARIIVEMARWSIRHERSQSQLVDRVRKNPDDFVADIHKRWVERATDSLLPTPATVERPRRRTRRQRARS